MRFSVITTTYNSEKFLPRTLKSVDEQTFTDFEHIIVDGFSTDATLPLVEEYSKTHHNVVLLKQPPSGISAAMNEGIRHARGEYIIHLHSDDSFVDTSVLKNVDVFLKEQPVDWVYGMIRVVEANGHIIGEWPKRKLLQHSSKSFLGKYILAFYNFIPHQGVFIKKNVFERYGFFDENLTSAMDQEMWLRIRNKTTWAFYNRVISNYTLRSGSQSASFERKTHNWNNYTAVQSKHLRWHQKPFAKLVNFFVARKSGNYR